jgi:hypothetical protein
LILGECHDVALCDLRLLIGALALARLPAGRQGSACEPGRGLLVRRHVWWSTMAW